MDNIDNNIITRELQKAQNQSSISSSQETLPSTQQLPAKRIDANPEYYKDSLGKHTHNDPFEQIMIKIRETAEGQKIERKEVEAFVRDIYTLNDEMKKVGLDLDTMLMAAYRDQLSLNEFMTNVEEEIYKVKRGELREMHHERLDKIDELIKKMKSSKLWNILGKVFGAIAAIAGGVASIATGGAAAVLGVALIAVTLVDTVDNALGDPMKKGIAKGLTDGSDDKVEKFTQWFELGINVLEIVLGLGATGAALAGKAAQQGAQAATAGQKVLQGGVNVLNATSSAGEGVTTIGKAASDYSLNHTRANLLLNEAEAQQLDEELRQILQLLQRALKQKSSHQQSMTQILQMQQAAQRWVR